MSRKLIRRAVAGTALVVAAATLPGVLSSPAKADDAATVTIVGTSDVSDSGLIQFLTPLFNADHPGLTLNYVSLGTGAAITQAESGTASALIVHAASLENQFVGSGFSAEPFGRAIFWGDYVLAGPASDPARCADRRPARHRRRVRGDRRRRRGGQRQLRLPRQHRRHPRPGARDLGSHLGRPDVQRVDRERWRHRAEHGHR